MRTKKEMKVSNTVNFFRHTKKLDRIMDTNSSGLESTDSIVTSWVSSQSLTSKQSKKKREMLES